MDSSQQESGLDLGNLDAPRGAPASAITPAAAPEGSSLVPGRTPARVLASSPSQLALPSASQSTASSPAPAIPPRPRAPLSERFQYGVWRSRVSRADDNKPLYICASNRCDFSLFVDQAHFYERLASRVGAASRAPSTPSRPPPSRTPSAPRGKSIRLFPRYPHSSASVNQPPSFLQRGGDPIESSPAPFPIGSRIRAMASFPASSPSSGDEDHKRRLSDSSRNGIDGSGKRLRTDDPPNTPSCPQSTSTGQTNAHGQLWNSHTPRAPRSTLLIASQGYRPSPSSRGKADNEQTAPIRERLIPIPATAPAATRTYDALPPSIRSTMPTFNCPQETSSSQSNLDHEFTIAVMNLIRNQLLAPAIRQALREKVNHFAFTTHSQRATIDNLRDRIKARDGVIESNEQEIVVLKNAVRKMRKNIENQQERIDTQDESIIEWRERYQKDGDLLVRRGRGLIRKKKTIKELEARIAELEGQMGEEQANEEQYVDDEEEKVESVQGAIEAEGEESESVIEVEDDIEERGTAQDEVGEMHEPHEELPDSPPSARTRRRTARASNAAPNTKEKTYIIISEEDDDSEFEEPDDESDDDYVDGA